MFSSDVIPESCVTTTPLSPSHKQGSAVTSASTTKANHPQGWDAKLRVPAHAGMAELPNGVVHAGESPSMVLRKSLPGSHPSLPALGPQLPSG